MDELEKARRMVMEIIAEVDLDKSLLTKDQILNLATTKKLLCPNPECKNNRSGNRHVLMNMDEVPEFWVIQTLGKQEVFIAPREVLIPCIHCNTETHLVFREEKHPY